MMNPREGDLYKVLEIEALKNKPKEGEATEILRKISNVVQPIMHRRKWKVDLLCEFCPPNPDLVGQNVNYGQKINLRLRSVNNEGVFLRYEDILSTMLHELCHNTYTAHDAPFDNLLDEIEKECEQLMIKNLDHGESSSGVSRCKTDFIDLTDEEWKCPKCTLLNSSWATTCNACYTTKPPIIVIVD